MPAAKRQSRRKPPRGMAEVRSIRFSDEEWADIEREALRIGITPSALVRQAVLGLVRRPVPVTPR